MGESERAREGERERERARERERERERSNPHTGKGTDLVLLYIQVILKTISKTGVQKSLINEHSLNIYSVVPGTWYLGLGTSFILKHFTGVAFAL